MIDVRDYCYVAHILADHAVLCLGGFRGGLRAQHARQQLRQRWQL